MNGTYACGQTVTFCYTVTWWNTTSVNWFHGIVANFGPGWDMSTLVPGPTPATCGGSGGTWGWYNSVQGTAGTNIGAQGPGFFFDLDNDGNPGNNFGDFCTGAVNWQFCWTISVLSGPACINGLGLGVTVNTFGDSETGSWGSAGCGNDPIAVSAPAVIQNCAANSGTGGPLDLCSTAPPQNLFLSLGNAPDAGGTWTDPNGAVHSGTFTPGTDIGGAYTYMVGTLVPPCSSSSVITVNLIPQPDAGTDGALTLCTSDLPTTLFTQLGGVPDPGGTWSGPGGASSGTFDPANDAAGIYTYSIAAPAPCVMVSSIVTVNVNPSPNAGSDGTLAACSNGVPQGLFPLLGGTPSAGGTWTTPGGMPFSGTYSPAMDGSGAYTYTVNGLAPCPNSVATVTVTENAQPDAGIDGVLTLCENAVLTDLFTSLGGAPGAGGTWSDPMGVLIAGIITPSTATSGNYTYTLPGIAPCVSDQAVVALTINSQPTAGSNSVQNLCESSPPLDLFTSLGGAPDPGGNWTGPAGTPVGVIFTPSVSVPGVYTYTLTATPPCANSVATVTVNISPQPSAGSDALLSVCSSSAASAMLPLLGATALPGGTWTDPNGTPTIGTFTPGTSMDGAYTYTIIGVAPCITSSATVTVTTTTAANPGVGAPISLCNSGAITNLATSLGGGPDPGGTWTTPSGGASTGSINPATAASGNYQYSIAANGPCPAASTTVAVTIVAQPNAGVDGATTLCSNQAAPYTLFTALGGAPLAGGTWTSPNGTPHTGNFSVGTDPVGAYTYTINAPAPCTSVSSEVTMSVVQAANAGAGGNVSFCENGVVVDPFTLLGGTPNAGGSWSAPGGGAITNIDPSTAGSGAYTYTITGTAPCPNAQSVMNVTIDVLPDAGMSTSIQLCANAPSLALLPLLGTTPGGNWTGPSGTASGTFIPGTTIPGIYTYTLNGTGACSAEQDQASVQVGIDPLPLPSFVVVEGSGCAPLQVQVINDDPAGTQSALWSFGNGGNSIDPAEAWNTYTTAGSFDITLEVTDANGCVGSMTMADAVLVSTGPAAEFYALPWRVSVNNPTTVITHTPAAFASYVWMIDGASIDTSGVFAWTFDPPTLGDHVICLTATDTLGCYNEICERVLVDDDLTIYVANAFTPNADGRNDGFRPSIIGVQEDWYDFMVFDRWGLLVFRTSDPYETWNGAFNNSGDILPTDVYVWTLKAKDQFTPEKAELIGTVTLLK